MFDKENLRFWKLNDPSAPLKMYLAQDIVLCETLNFRKKMAACQLQKQLSTASVEEFKDESLDPRVQVSVKVNLNSGRLMGTKFCEHSLAVPARVHACRCHSITV